MHQRAQPGSFMRPDHFFVSRRTRQRTHCKNSIFAHLVGSELRVSQIASNTPPRQFVPRRRLVTSPGRYFRRAFLSGMKESHSPIYRYFLIEGESIDSSIAFLDIMTSRDIIKRLKCLVATQSEEAVLGVFKRFGSVRLAVYKLKIIEKKSVIFDQHFSKSQSFLGSAKRPPKSALDGSN